MNARRYSNYHYRRHVPTDQLVDQLLMTETDSFFRLFWLLMCDCGLRISEVLGLKWSDLFLTDGQSRSYITVKGKCFKHRTVPVPARLRLYLQDLKATFHVPFTMPVPICKYGVRWVQYHFRKLLYKCACFNPKISCHSLRHYYATRLVNAGVNIFTISRVLGHESLETTAAYLHLDENYHQEVISALSGSVPPFLGLRPSIHFEPAHDSQKDFHQLRLPWIRVNEIPGLAHIDGLPLGSPTLN